MKRISNARDVLRYKALIELACIESTKYTKSQWAKNVLPLIRKVVPAQSTQLLEHIGDDNFIKYYEDLPPKKIILQYGYTKWVFENQRFLIIAQTDPENHLGIGYSAPIGDISHVREEIIKYATPDNRDEKSLIIYPLIRHGITLGTLKLCDFTKEQAFGLADIELVHPICQAVATLLHNFNLFQSQKTSRDQLESMNRQLDELLERFKLSGDLAFGSYIAYMELHDISGLLTELISCHERAYFDIQRFPLSKAQKSQLSSVITQMDSTIKTLERRINKGLSGKILFEEINQTPCNLKEVIFEMLEKYHTTLSAKSVQLRAFLGKADAYIMIDKRIVQEVIRILMNNSLQAIEARKPRQGIIKIYSRSEKGYIQVFFQDNGCGITPANIRRIWEPFFTTNPLNRHGLGLFLAKRFLIQISGELTLASTYINKGTTFKLEFQI
jgi:signal transduction histidine kinase